MTALFQNVFAYLQTRSVFRLLFDTVIMMAVVTWLSVMYMMATNYPSVVQIFDSLRSESSKVDVRTATLLNRQVDNELSNLTLLTGADRAELSKFHNGKKDLNGVHFVFSSRTNEVVLHGAGSELVKTQNVPLSFFSDVMAKLIEHQCYEIEVRPNSTPTYEWWNDMGIDSLIRCPVFNIDNDIVAYIGLDWVSSKMDQSKIKDYMKLTQEVANRIGVIVAIQDPK
jgi:hypothetical protein